MIAKGHRPRGRFLAGAACLGALTLAAAALVAGRETGGRDTRPPGSLTVAVESALEGGRIYSVAAATDGSSYAATSRGVFIASAGARWRGPFELGGTWRGPFAVDAEDVVAYERGAYAVGSDDVWMTVDGGRTWRTVLPESIEREYMSETYGAPLAVGASGVVYILTEFRGGQFLYRSTDGGRTWNERRAFEVGRITVLAADPIAADAVYLSAGRLICTSRDGGRHLRCRTGPRRGVEVTALAVAPTSPRTIYAGTSRGILKSVDGGATWARAPGSPVGVKVVDLVLDPANADVIHAATTRGVVTGTDGGTTWRTTRVPGPRIVDLAAHRNGTLLAASLGRGVMRSRDGAARWLPMNAGLNAVSPSEIAVETRSPNAVYLATDDGSGLMTSFDGGRSWSPPTGAPTQEIHDVVADGAGARPVAYLATDEGVLHSRDRGATWDAVGDDLGAIRVFDLAIHAGRRETLYASPEIRGVYKTVDGGDSWRRILPRWSGSTLAVDPRRPATVYAAVQSPLSSRNRVYVSRDAGSTWSRRDAGISPDEFATDVVVAPTGDVLLVTEPSPYRGGAYLLRPGAARWTRADAGLPRDRFGEVRFVWSIEVHPRTGRFYAGTARGLYELVGAAPNRRPSWRLVEPTLGRAAVTALAFAADGSRLYAATPGHFLVLR